MKGIIANFVSCMSSPFDSAMAYESQKEKISIDILPSDGELESNARKVMFFF